MLVRRFFIALTFVLLGGAIVACSTTGTPKTEAVTLTESLATSTLPEPTAQETAKVEDQPVVSETDAPAIEPIEVTYFTPPQQEGPYYPIDKPADRDNDLVDLAGATAAPAGEVLFLAGIVYDAGGLPVEGAVVEIWQTDSNGVYLHPNDPGTDRRDPNFQFYGEARTGADGVYSFRTILPGLYEPRPRHIHFKVRLNGEVLLTSQFYFGNEVTFSGAEANLVIDIAPAEDDFGNPVWVGERDIILSIDL